MPAVDKLCVRLDATQILPVASDTVIRDSVTVLETQAQAIMGNLWFEPMTACVMAQPAQMSDDFYLNSDVERFGKDKWILTDSHWEERWREYDRWLVSDGTDETIETKKLFDANTAFYLSVFICGDETDDFEALTVWFGQWKLVVRSTGKATLYVVKDTGDFARGSGWLTGHTRNSLCNRISNIMIMPSSDGSIFIRRNGTAGFVTPVPDSEKYENSSPESEGTGELQVIRPGSVKIKAGGGQVRFQFSELAFDATADCFYISPNRELAEAPASGAAITAEVDQLNLGGLIIVAVYEGYDTDDPPESIDDLTLFSTGDGTTRKYCIGVTINPTAARSPMFRGATVIIEPAEPEAPTDPSDITADIKSCTIEGSQNPVDTQATLVLRDVSEHPILGKCNRWCDIKVGDTVVMRGVLKEPPALVYQGPYAVYELTVQSVAKFLSQPCLHSNVRFDGMEHTAAVEWLCQFAGLAPSDLEFQPDDTTLDNTATRPDGSDSKLRPGIADVPIEWIEKICELTGWEFLDGPLSSGDYGMIYEDPLNRDTTAIHTFYFHSEDSAGVDAYDLVHGQARFYAAEPEANELWVVGCNQKGERIAAVYRDARSQDPDLVEEDPAADPPQDAETIRPGNWLGFKKIGLIPIKGRSTLDILKRIALRIGKDIAQRADMVDFEGDWKPGLWRGKYICLDTMEDEDLPAYSTSDVWRIEQVSSINFLDEGNDYPVRRAQYTAVRGRTYSVEVGDQRLLRDIREYIRNGGNADVNRGPISGVPGANDEAGALPGTGPITEIAIVVDSNGLEEFVLGVNGMDATTVVQ